jgi:hypothetical protein
MGLGGIHCWRTGGRREGERVIAARIATLFLFCYIGEDEREWGRLSSGVTMKNHNFTYSTFRINVSSAAV